MKPRFRRRRVAPARPSRHHPFERCLPLLLALLAGLPMTAQAAKLSVDIEGLSDALLAKVRPELEIAQYEALEVAAAQAERLCERVPEQMKRDLEPLGYYEASAECRLEADGDDWRARVQVQPGEPIRVAGLELTLSAADARDVKAVRAALDAFGPRVGDVFEEDRYERSKAAVMAALVGQGYFDARMLTHVVEVTSAARSAVIRLAIDTGTRSRIGVVRFEGSQFRDGFLDRYVPWTGVVPYSSDLLLSLQQRLSDAGYFSQIDVEPELEDSVEGVVPIRVQLAPAPRTVYRGGVFVGTDTGAGVRAGYERRWVNDRGHKLNVDAQLAQYLRTLGAIYTMPQPGPNDRSYNLGAVLRDEHTTSVDSRTAELVGNEVRQWQGWTRTLGLHLLGGDFTVGGEDGNSVMLYPELGLVRKRGDHPSFVTHGYALSLVGRTAAQSLLSDSNLLQVRADVNWIDALSPRDRLILRGSAGTMAANHFDELPPELRFFAGGDRSIRGYGYESIGPRNANDEVIGGKSLLVASAEVEHYFDDKWGVATFVDTGDAFTGSHFALKVGTGLGLRWRSPVGLVRVDVATSVNDSHESGVQLHLMIGPDL